MDDSWHISNELRELIESWAKTIMQLNSGMAFSETATVDLCKELEAQVSEPIVYGGIGLPELKDNELILDGVFLLKVLGEDGSVYYREFKTPTLHAIEALGMTETFQDTLRQAIMNNARKIGD